MALTDYVYQCLQAIPDKRTSVAVVKAFERAWPRSRVANITAAMTLNETAHEGKLLTVNSAAGIAIVLPASTGQGARYRLFIGTTVTSSATTIKVANASDIMIGTSITNADDTASTAKIWKTGSTDDTISLNGTTTGGVKGDYIEIEDSAVNTWRVSIIGVATDTEATPFSATVS